MIKSLEERFYTKFEIDYQPNGCWTWLGVKALPGYGRMRATEGRLHFAHRLSYELHKGESLAGKQLDHICNNKACVNPDHLEITTQSENVRRGYRRDGRIHRESKKTHCKRGHEFTEDNTYINRKGHRYCRECKRQTSNRRYYENKKC